MATLLTRLREWPDNPLCIEAADEIERLRDLLEWLHRRGGLGLDVHDRIRAALTGRKD